MGGTVPKGTVSYVSRIIDTGGGLYTIWYLVYRPGHFYESGERKYETFMKDIKPW